MNEEDITMLTYTGYAAGILAAVCLLFYYWPMLFIYTFLIIFFIGAAVVAGMGIRYIDENYLGGVLK